MMVVDGVHLEINRSQIDAVMEGFMAKVALITGGNKGLGFEVARQLGRAGFTVLLELEISREEKWQPTSCVEKAMTSASLSRI
jgi:NAD(P)-dependent dehydrogenase (short-subunit alcohol dehydrogenase family)